jgi:hypothetical protein
LRPPVSKNQQLPNISHAPVSLGLRGFKKMQDTGFVLPVTGFLFPVISDDF